MTIGAENMRNCDTNWLTLPNQPPVDSAHAVWTVRFESFKFGSSFGESTPLSVALSTAGDYFVAPKRHANRIYAQLGAYYSRYMHGGIVDCALQHSAPTLEFSVAGGRTIQVTASVYIKRFVSTRVREE